MLSEGHPLIVDPERCARLMLLFDSDNNGLIVRDEFVEAAQFLTVANFLATTQEGLKIKEQAEQQEPSMRLARLIHMLEREPQKFEVVLRSVPKVLAAQLMSSAFEEECNTCFAETAPGSSSSNNVGDFTKLVPLVTKMIEASPYPVDGEKCATFTAAFSRGKDTSYGLRFTAMDFVAMVRYVHLLAYLSFTYDHQNMAVQEVILGKQKILSIMEALRSGVGEITSIITFLPDELVVKHKTCP